MIILMNLLGMKLLIEIFKHGGNDDIDQTISGVKSRNAPPKVAVSWQPPSASKSNKSD